MKSRVRSGAPQHPLERQLMEQKHYNLLFRRFIGLSMDRPVWVPTVFTKNRERLIKHDAVIEYFNEVQAIAQKKVTNADGHAEREAA